MTGYLDPLKLRKQLGREHWGVPQRFGPDGWLFDGKPGNEGRVIVTCWSQDGTHYVHASISRPTMPSYDDLKLLHAAVWGSGYAYQLFVPPSEHVNIHDRALHLWGALDGRSLLPFTFSGTI